MSTKNNARKITAANRAEDWRGSCRPDRIYDHLCSAAAIDGTASAAALEDDVTPTTRAPCSELIWATSSSLSQTLQHTILQSPRKTWRLRKHEKIVRRRIARKNYSPQNKNIRGSHVAFRAKITMRSKSDLEICLSSRVRGLLQHYFSSSSVFYYLWAFCTANSGSIVMKNSIHQSKSTQCKKQTSKPRHQSMRCDSAEWPDDSRSINSISSCNRKIQTCHQRSLFRRFTKTFILIICHSLILYASSSLNGCDGNNQKTGIQLHHPFSGSTSKTNPLIISSAPTSTPTTKVSNPLISTTDNNNYSSSSSTTITSRISSPPVLHQASSTSIAAKSATAKRRCKRRNNTGFYYGLRDDHLISHTTPTTTSRRRLPSLPTLHRESSLNIKPSPMVKQIQFSLENGREKISSVWKKGRSNWNNRSRIVGDDESTPLSPCRGRYKQHQLQQHEQKQLSLQDPQQQRRQQQPQSQQKKQHLAEFFSCKLSRFPSGDRNLNASDSHSLSGVENLISSNQNSFPSTHLNTNPISGDQAPQRSYHPLTGKLHRCTTRLLRHPTTLELSSSLSQSISSIRKRQRQHHREKQQQLRNLVKYLSNSISQSKIFGIESLPQMVFPTLNIYRSGHHLHHQHHHHEILRGGGGTTSTKTSAPNRKKRRKNNTGFYYGIREDVLEPTNPPGKDKHARGEGKKRREDTIEEGIVRKNADHEDRRSVHASPSATWEEESPSDNEGRGGNEDENGGVGIDNDEGRKHSGEDVNALKDDPLSPQKPNLQKSQSPVMSSPEKEDESLKKKKRDTKRKQLRAKKATSFRGFAGDDAPEDVIGETLQELRAMKEEIMALRKELRALQLLRGEEGIYDGDSYDDDDGEAYSQRQLTLEKQETGDNSTPSRLREIEATPKAETKVSKRMRQREFEQIGKSVEKWASRLLFEEERAGNGWKEVSCNNFVRKKFNSDGRTQVFLKWMPDSRENIDTSDDRTEYPCIKCYSTIDAPMDKVCSFLADERNIPIYNELIDDHCDVEEITPHSKITWTKCPKILFVKPRDFVTFCYHRWWRDGTQVIVSQACDHEDKPGVMEEGKGDVCRGFALRGANFISKDPEDPMKTRITLLSHANPGGGLPHWAMNTAVNGAVQIEPFKLFHKINEGVRDYEPLVPSQTMSHTTASVGSLPGRSNKPAGIAQLGYVCFWPDGGGLKEANPFSHHPHQDGNALLEAGEGKTGYDDD